MLRLKNELLAFIRSRECQIRTSGWMACKILDCRVGGQNPAVLITSKPCWIVHIHFEEILVKTIRTTNPTAGCVKEGSVGDVHIRTHKPREWLARRLRIQQITLCFL